MKPLFLIAPLAMLAACTDPRQACLNSAQQDLRVVRALIADSEATLERGYVIQTETRHVIYTDFCFGAHGHHVGYRFCDRVLPVTSKKPVAVDLGEERRKLKSLRVKERELERRTARDIRVCNQTYPATDT